MNKSVLGLCFLALGASLARGQTTDDYYSVQNGYWDNAVTWTSPALAPYGHPRAGDRAFVFHVVTVTGAAACAEAVVTGSVEIVSPGLLDIHQYAQFYGGRVSGTGTLKTWGTTSLTGMPSWISAEWFNIGDVQVQTPSLQLETNFYNNGGTVVVHAGTFTLSGTTGVGRVVNLNGLWQIRPGATCNVTRFESQGNLWFVGGTGSIFRTVDSCRLAGGTWQLDEGAQFVPASTDCTAYIDGDYNTTGSGLWQFEGGTTYVSHASATTTTFTGGTYYWRVDEVDVPPDGEMVNQGDFHIPGSAATQSLGGTFVNRGNAWLGSVTGGTGHCRFNGTWSNAPGGTTTVTHSDFRWRGTGTFANAGTFRVANGVTGTTESVRFRQLGGTFVLGTGSIFAVRGNRQQHTGGSFLFATDAVCQVGCGGTDYWDGVYTAAGEGALVLTEGTLNCAFYSATTTVFDVGGGGFRIVGGTVNVNSSQALENRGTMVFAATSTPATLGGELQNFGRVYFGAPSSSLLTAPGGGIVNQASGVWTFDQEGGAIDVLTDHFYNHGTVNFQAAETTLGAPFFNMPDGTTTFHCGTANLPGGLVVYGGRAVLAGGTIGPPGSGIYMLDMGGGGTLCGTGHVANHINHTHGTLAPGHSPGGFDIGGYYEQGSNATLQIEIGGKKPGTEYDQLVVASYASVQGTLEVSFWNGYAPAGGERFDILLSAGRTDTFAATNLPILGPGLSWLMHYRANGVQLRVASPTDTDGDGLDDDWENTHFHDLATSDGGTNDYDVDKYTDYLEQFLDTQPTNPASYLSIAAFSVAGSNGVVTLHTGSNAQYAIETRTNLADPAEAWAPADEFSGTGGTVVRSNAAAGLIYYYRLKATVP